MRTPIGQAPTLPTQLSKIGIGRVIETVFHCDIWEEFQDLKNTLRIADGHADYRTLLRISNDAEHSWLRASKLLANAELEFKRFEIETRKLTATMRNEAVKQLNAEKKDGERRKSITNQDLDDWAATVYVDQWTEQEISRVKYSQTIDHIKVLVEAWKSRCRTLQGMLAQVKRGPLT